MKEFCSGDQSSVSTFWDTQYTGMCQCKGGFPVTAEITRILAANIRRQFFLLSPLQRVLAAWFKIFN